MYRILIPLLLLNCNMLFSQNIVGKVVNTESNKPLEFVNVGIVGKNIGTVTGLNGLFSLEVDKIFDSDSLLFSSIGFTPLQIKIADLRAMDTNIIVLQTKIYPITEVNIRPKQFKENTLGVNTKFKKIAAGFKDNNLGYECGILMKSKKRAHLKKVAINIAHCSYDTIYYRLNIYKVIGEMQFENILKEPIFIEMSKELITDEIQIDLKSKNIVVEGDFLITLEHIKDLGDGYIYFCAAITDKTYYRKTSQGSWETAAVGVAISVVADIEK